MKFNTQSTQSSSFRKIAVLLSCWLMIGLLAIPAAQPTAAIMPSNTAPAAPPAAKPVSPVTTGSVVTLNTPAAITATCVVTNTNNTGVGSLKGQLALGNGVCDRITFDPLLAGKTITVTGEISLPTNRVVVIDGVDAPGLKLSGNNANRIFNVSTTTVKLSLYNLTLQNGKVTGANGGAVLNQGGTVAVSNTTFLNNSAQFGGAIRNQVNGSTAGKLTVYNSYFSGNQALNGGAITINNGSTTIQNSAFVDNRATGTTVNQGAGGAIQSLNQANPTPILTTYITNTTIANNYARNGAAIFNDNNGRISVAHSTIANNVVGTGIQNLADVAAVISVRTSNTGTDEPKLFSLSHTIVANTVVSGTNGIALDVAKTATAPAFTSVGYNLIENPSTAPFIGNTATNIIGVDPALAPLANNGGSTPTFALISGSPAINAGDPSFAGVPATDQRGAGFPRVVGGRIDIGAFEGSVPDTAQTGTLVVNTTNDSDDGVCGTTFCSLREAITFANSTPTSDTITFNIGGAGTRTISPTTPLPAITAPVVLDATTQPGASCNAPTVEINGSLAGAGANGFTVNTSNSTIKGFVINNFSANGIALNGTSNTVACNWIGLNSTGTADAGNTLDGVAVKGDQAMLMDNTISGNNRYGVYVNVSAAPVGSMIKSNFIGTNAAGTTGISNTVGIFVDATPRTMIGGTTAADRNVISGNGEQGIVIRNTGATNNVVQSNLIGTNAGGTVGVPNNDGIYIFDVANTSVLSNTIAGNKRDGIVVGGGATANTQIKSNFIGTTANNATTVGNFSNGIVLDGTNGVVIGGIGAGNVIAGNGNNGIDLRSNFVRNTTIKGNFIGVAANGTTSIPNQLNGIRAANSNTTNLSMIGGTTVGEGNTIAFNKQNGVVVVNAAAVGYSIIGNSIFSNTGLGIDLAGDGVTANDAGDGDTGANTLQNFPVLTSVNANLNTTQVQGTLNSTANGPFALHFYSSADCDPSNHGEGQNYLGSTSVTTNASGTASFNVTLPTGTAAGQKVTATATNSTGSTSEFSQCFTVGNLPTLSVGNVSVNEGDSGTTNANFVLTLSAVSTSDVVVQYATSDGTATNPEDYIATTGTITITAGQTTATISVPVNGDLKDEADETFFLNLTDATNASINNGQAQATISDDDDAPTMSIADASVVEGNSGMTTMVFTVTLSNPSSTPISVTYTTQNGTATAADYTPISGTLTFAANETSKVIEVMVLGDVLIEGNETFTVELSGASVVLADATATGTIIDNDVPTISIADVSINEGNTGTVTMVFTVTLSESSSQTVTVNYATANDTATAGSDYVAASGTLTFAPGETSKTISVTVNGDTAVEGDETFFVNLSNAVNATLADSQAIGTIVEGQEQFKIYLPLILKNG